MTGTTALEAETAEVLLVAIQAGTAAGAVATASPTAGAAVVAAIAGPVIAAEALPAAMNTGSPSVGDAAKESTRSTPNMQKGVVESLNACGVALQQLSYVTDYQSTCTALGKVADRSMQFLQGHDGRSERMLDTL